MLLLKTRNTVTESHYHKPFSFEELSCQNKYRENFESAMKKKTTLTRISDLLNVSVINRVYKTTLIHDTVTCAKYISITFHVNKMLCIATE